MKIIIASDHAGFDLKQAIFEHLRTKNEDVTDAGPPSAESCDYSHYALLIARSVSAGEYDRGVLVCGTGIGMSMAANRIKGARAALCFNEYMARMSRNHNDANILCLGQRTTGVGLALATLETFLTADFEGGRHQRRLSLFD
ncbi:MAG: ribose 5-phosphate isomerase B [Deltaproteobacteria bacterium]|nr:ribose 5-phosphate isomerase B [Deltaproteobacteria bacterium]